MRLVQPSRLLCFALASGLQILAQIGPFPAASVPVTPIANQVVALPMGASPVLTNVVVDTVAAGGDTIDANFGDPAVVISLLTPGGVEITLTNAASLGFGFSTYTSDGFSREIPTPLTSGGTHTLITFPAGQSPGTYQVKANTSAATGDTGMSLGYYSPSNVRAGAITDATAYRTGDFVILSALVFDGNGPVPNATVTATAVTSSPVQGLIGSYQLVSQQAGASGFTIYTYTVQFTNSGAATTGVTATVVSSDPNTQVLNSFLIFGSAGAGGTATSANSFSVQLPSAATFDPSVLSWTLTAAGTPVQVTLQDSGTYDAAPGDGVYTGVFTPPTAGSYSVFLTVTGSSLSGVPFMRTPSTAFEVDSPSAQLAGFSDAPVPSGAPFDHVAVTANVAIQIAGTYRLTLDLVASNGKTTEVTTSANLTAGSQQMELDYPAANIFALGVGGPYTETNARLVLVGSSRNTLADYSANPGSTQAYALSSFAPSVYFTGQASATGVITGTGPTFDLLNVQMGVQLSTASGCSWSGQLADSAGNAIDYSTGNTYTMSSSELSAGANSITLSFSGLKIAQSAGGPYVVRSIGLYCDIGNANSPPYTVTGFTNSQFTSGTPNFTMSLMGPAPMGIQGSTASSLLQVTASGGFQGMVTFNVSGLPSGATGAFSFPEVIESGITQLVVSIPSNLALGAYPFTVGYSSGSTAKTFSVTLTVTTQVAAPVFSPPAGPYSSPQNVTITSATSGAAIRYTTDGSIPTDTSGTPYTMPVAGIYSQTLNAIASKSGMVDSVVVSGAYTPGVAAPTFSPAAGTYSSGQMVTISSATSFASINYTIDGSTPSESAGIPYSGPITVSNTTTLKAIAYRSGSADSAIASATYTITSGGPAWYSSSWQHRKAITVNVGQVPSTQTNFPMLVSLPSDSGLAANALANGYDIVFTDSSGSNILPYERELYNASTGQLIAWVKVPSMSDGTVIYMYFGNSSETTDQQNANGTWDSNFKGVWHMGNSSVSGADSTANGNTGALTSVTSTTGEIGGAASFNSSSSNIGVGMGNSLKNSVLTWEVWLNPTGTPSSAWGVIDQSSTGPSLQLDNGREIDVGQRCSFGFTSSSVPVNTWSQVTVSWDTGSGAWVVYKNGAAINSGTQTASFGFGGTTTIGVDNTDCGPTGTNFQGYIDEVRMSNIVRSADWITTEYNNQSAPSSFLSKGSLETFTPWYSSSWQHRKAITVNVGQVPSTQTNFPMLVSLPSDSGLAANALANGYDIVFTDSSGSNVLPYERELYNASTGQLIAWVKVPSMSDGTVIYMYFGNSSETTDQQNANGTWDSNFKGVWHMGNSSVSGADSTANGNTGALTSVTSTTGEIGGAASFNSSSSNIGVGMGNSLKNSVLTWEVWLNPTGTPSSAWGVIDQSSTGPSLQLDNGREIDVGQRCSFGFTSSSVPVNTWSQVTVSWDTGSGAWVVYKNGAAINSGTQTASFGFGGTTTIGVDNTDCGPTGTNFQGYIDEVRMSNIVRSADWITTEYNNQSAPSSFLTAGPLQ